ncbi:MAG: hypothetical protein WBQ73_00290 [Candidatus Babeliales bacterium]
MKFIYHTSVSFTLFLFLLFQRTFPLPSPSTSPALEVKTQTPSYPSPSHTTILVTRNESQNTSTFPYKKGLIVLGTASTSIYCYYKYQNSCSSFQKALDNLHTLFHSFYTAFSDFKETITHQITTLTQKITDLYTQQTEIKKAVDATNHTLTQHSTMMRESFAKNDKKFNTLHKQGSDIQTNVQKIDRKLDLTNSNLGQFKKHFDTIHTQQKSDQEATSEQLQAVLLKIAELDKTMGNILTNQTNQHKEIMTILRAADSAKKETVHQNDFK